MFLVMIENNFDSISTICIWDRCVKNCKLVIPQTQIGKLNND